MLDDDEDELEDLSRLQVSEHTPAASGEDELGDDTAATEEEEDSDDEFLFNFRTPGMKKAPTNPPTASPHLSKPSATSKRRIRSR